MKSGIAVPLLAVLFCLDATAANAQSGFIGAGAGMAAIRFSHQSSESPAVSDNDISGDTSAWSFTAGTGVARRGVLQVEFGKTTALKREIPPIAFLNPCPSCSRTTTTAEYRSNRLGILMGYTRTPSRRFSVSALGGLAIVHQTVHIRAVTSFVVPPPSPILPNENTSTNYLIGPEFGIDAAIALSRHLRVVPEARVYRLGSSTSFLGNLQALVTTVSVGGRWYF